MLVEDTKISRICTECRHHKMINVPCSGHQHQPHVSHTHKVNACFRLMSVVTGESTAVPCDVMRSQGPCGANGRLHESISGMPILNMPMGAVDGPTRKKLPENDPLPFQALGSVLQDIVINLGAPPPTEVRRTRRPPKKEA